MSTRNNKRFGWAAPRVLSAGLLAMLLLWACNLNSEKGNTYFEIKADSAWAKYEYLRITWTDPATGNTRDLFYGTPSEFGTSRKLADDTYQGQKIEITITGITANKTVLTEVLVYLGTENKVDSVKAVLLPGMALTYDDKALEMGEKDSLNLPLIHVSPEALFDKTLQWSSSNNNIFSVEGERIIAKSAGSATLIGALNADPSKLATFSVTVTAYKTPVEKVKFQADSLDIFVGVAATDLVVDVFPTQANPGVEFSLSETTFAKIESGRILGLAEGRLEVYVKSKDNTSARDTLPVAVLPNPNTGKPVPEAPVIAALEVLDGKLSLTWMSVSGADTYNLYYQEGSTIDKASGTPIKGAASPATLSGLKNGTPYALALTAVNTSGESGLGPVRTGTPVAAIVVKPLPEAPVIAAVEVLDGKLSLTWVPVSGADTYNLYYQEGSTVGKTSGTQVTSVTSPATLPGLQNGTQYALALTAVNATGESGLGPVRTAAPEGPIIVQPKKPTVTLAQKSAVLTINDTLAFSATATVEDALLKSYAWDYNGDGVADAQGPLNGASAEITGGYRYPIAGPFKAILKVFTDGDSSAQAQADIQVLQDLPVVNAGMDITVYTDAAVQLAGMADDSLGAIVKTEWKIGGAEFRSARLDTAFTAPAMAGDVECILQATDDDGQSVRDTMVVHVIARTQAYLTEITPSFGRFSPPFNPTTLAYADTVPFDTTAIRFVVAGNGTVKVNTAEVATGTSSASLPLDTGRNTIAITVELPNVPAKTYTVIVFRTPGSNDANLSVLTPSSGVLLPSLNAADSVYRDSVLTTVQEIKFTPMSSDLNAKVTVNRALLPRGETSAAIPLKTGSNEVLIEVTAQNGRKKTYTINVIRRFSEEARLSALILTGTGLNGTAVMPLDVPFVSGTYEYSSIPTDGQVSVKVQATTMDTGATLTVNGGTVASGALSGAVTLKADTVSSLIIQVTSQDRKVVLTYTLKFPRVIDVGFASDQSGTRIFKTLDRGKTWKKMANIPYDGNNQPAMAAYFPDVNTGYVVGTQGPIHKTSDGGKTWTKQVSGTTLYLWDVYFTSRDVGYVAGGLPGNGTEAAQGIILKTIDGGATWSRQLFPYTCFFSVQFVNANVGYAGGLGADTSLVQFGSVYKTINAGVTWTPVARPHDCKQIGFVDANTGLSVGNGGASRTTDGGATWTKLDISPTGYISGIKFLNSTIGHIYGYEGIKKTADAGLTWVDQLPGDAFMGVGFWDAATGLVAGGGAGTVMRTANGGSTWAPVVMSTTGGINWVFCFKP